MLYGTRSARSQIKSYRVYSFNLHTQKTQISCANKPVKVNCDDGNLYTFGTLVLHTVAVPSGAEEAPWGISFFPTALGSANCLHKILGSVHCLNSSLPQQRCTQLRKSENCNLGLARIQTSLSHSSFEKIGRAHV